MGDQHGPGMNVEAFLVGNLVVALIVWFVVWGICAAIAANVAPQGRELRFFLLTFFILGPLGVGFAAIAPPAPSPPLPQVEGMVEFQCDRCGALQNVDESAKTVECWQCGEEYDTE